MKENIMAIEQHKLVSRFDAETNEMIAQDEFKVRSKNLKAPGYQLVYMQELKETLLMCKSVTQVYIILDILAEKIDKEFKLELTYQDLAKEYNVSLSTATNILAIMKQSCIIKGSNGVYDVNPYLVIPKRVRDDVVTFKQARWGAKDGKVYGSVSE